MAANFTFQFVLSQKEKDKICQSCCVKIDVFRDGRRFQRKYYCLHCEKVYSRSGMHVHRNTFSLLPEDVKHLEELFYENVRRHEVHVKGVFEKLGVKGMRRTSLVHPQQAFPFELPVQQIEHAPPTRHPRVHRRQPAETRTNEGFETVALSLGHQDDDYDDEVQKEYPDLFGCFSKEGFDPKRFNEWAEDFFRKSPCVWTDKNLTKSKRKRPR